MPRHRSVRPLTAEELAALEDLARGHQKPRVQNRARGILLSGTGLTVLQIAKKFRAGYQTVHDWIDAFEKEGIAGLEEGQRSGARPKAGTEYRRQLRIAYAREPAMLGYDADRWTALLLRDHLAKITGIRMSEDRVRQLVRIEKID